MAWRYLAERSINSAAPPKKNSHKNPQKMFTTLENKYTYVVRYRVCARQGFETKRNSKLIHSDALNDRSALPPHTAHTLPHQQLPAAPGLLSHAVQEVREGR